MDHLSDSIKSISLNYGPCQARPILVDINSDEPLCYSFPVSVNKFYGSCNTIASIYPSS